MTSAWSFGWVTTRRTNPGMGIPGSSEGLGVGGIPGFFKFRTGREILGARISAPGVTGTRQGSDILGARTILRFLGKEDSIKGYAGRG